MPEESEIGESQIDESEIDRSETPAGGGPVDEGPGCMPAILASVVLMGMMGFVICAFSTWVLFQQRTELALRTLRGTVIPQVEQGLLEPDTKSQVVDELTSLADDLERGKHEDWQAAGAMSRLIRVPIFQWGQIQAIEAYLAKNKDDSYTESIKQISRLQRAVELGKANAIDFEDVLAPARVADPEAPTGYSLDQPLNDQQVADVVERAKLVADRSEIPDQLFENVELDAIIRSEIERGLSP
jgi:hypothetical protein